MTTGSVGRSLPSVAVVAHNPGLQTLVAELLALAEGDGGFVHAARFGFAPASAAVFRIDGPEVACEGLFTPQGRFE